MTASAATGVSAATTSPGRKGALSALSALTTATAVRRTNAGIAGRMYPGSLDFDSEKKIIGNSAQQRTKVAGLSSCVPIFRRKTKGVKMLELRGEVALKIVFDDKDAEKIGIAAGA